MSQVKAGAAYVEIATRNSKLLKGLADAQKRLQAFGSATRSLGFQVMGVGTGMLAPLLGSAKIFSDSGDQIQKMAIRTGISTEALSTLGFAAEQSGSNLESLEAGIIKMQRSLVDAARGSQSTVEGFAALGLSANELLKLAPDEQFKAIAEAIKQVKDPALKAALAMRVFGRGGAGLIPFLEEGKAGIEALQEEARSLGLELGQDDANLAADLNDALNRLMRSMKAVTMAIGSALAESINRALVPLTKLVVGVIQWIKTNKALVVTAFKIAGLITVIGGSLIALGATFALISTAIGGFLSTLGFVSGVLSAMGTLFAALVSPIGLVSMAVLGLGTYLLYASGVGGQAIQWLGTKFDTLRSDVSTAMGAIGKALTAGDLSSAAKILWLTLKLEWMRGIRVLTEYWVAFKDSMLSVTEGLTYGMAQAISDGWAGIEVAWVETIGFLADAWSLFTGTLTKTWYSTVGFIKKAWTRLKGMFDSEIDVNAEVQRIDQETTNLNENANKKMLNAIGERDQERKNRRSQIESERQGRSAALEQAQKSDAESRRQQGQSAIDAAAQELDLAKQEWRKAIEDLNAEDVKESPTSQLDPNMAALKQALSGSGQAVNMEQQTAEAKSTFNAFAIRGLGADRLSDRQLQAAEQTAANTRKLIQVVEDSRLSYS
ncbi:hypothetical protein SH501x_004504 [Pirellulaceae bacterium SH501]